MVVIVAIGLFFIYSKKGISTYNAIVPSIGEKNNIRVVRKLQFLNNFLIKTAFL